METTITIPQLDTLESKIDQLTKKVDELTNGKAKKENPNLTRKDAADYLKMSLSTLDSHRRDGLIKGFKLGKKRLYKFSEIEKLSQTLK